jgi:hypothetical protein
MTTQTKLVRIFEMDQATSIDFDSLALPSLYNENEIVDDDNETMSFLSTLYRDEPSSRPLSPHSQSASSAVSDVNGYSTVYQVSTAFDQSERSALIREMDEANVLSRKKVRYDKLGRMIEEKDMDTPSLAPRRSDNDDNQVKRPRGRPPKGKMWDDKRGWIDEGLGLRTRKFQ